MNNSAPNLVWVPVRIKYDDSIGRLQVQSKATSTSAENEHEDLRVRVIKHRQQLSTIIALCCPVKAQVLVTCIPTTTTLVWRPFSRTTEGSWYQTATILDFIGARMMVFVTNGATRGAKLQSYCCHQQTNTQLFRGWMPFLLPNRQHQRTAGKIIFHGLAHPGSPGGGSSNVVFDHKTTTLILQPFSMMAQGSHQIGFYCLWQMELQEAQCSSQIVANKPTPNFLQARFDCRIGGPELAGTRMSPFWI